jgi:hypothetical protein
MMIKDRVRVTVIVEPFTVDDEGLETPLGATATQTHRRVFDHEDDNDGKYHLQARLWCAARGWLSDGCPDPRHGQK